MPFSSTWGKLSPCIRPILHTARAPQRGTIAAASSVLSYQRSYHSRAASRRQKRWKSSHPSETVGSTAETSLETSFEEYEATNATQRSDISHAIDGVDVIAKWEEDGNRSSQQPSPQGPLFEAVFEYLDVRGTSFKQVASCTPEVVKQILEQVFPDNPVSVHNATKEWHERIEEGRLSRRYNNSEVKTKGKQQVYLLQRFIDKGDVGRALGVLRTLLVELRLPLFIVTPPLTRLFKSRLIRPQNKRKARDQVLQYLGEIGGRPDLKLFTIFLRICESYKEVQDVFRSMVHNGLQPDALSFAAAMKARESSVQETRNIFSNMRAANVDPTEVHYGILLRSTAISKEYPAAEKLWERMTQHNLCVTPHTWSIYLSTILAQLPWVCISMREGEQQTYADPPQLTSDLTEGQSSILKKAAKVVSDAHYAGAESWRLLAHFSRALPFEERLPFLIKTMSRRNISSLSEVDPYLVDSCRFGVEGRDSVEAAVRNAFSIAEPKKSSVMVWEKGGDEISHYARDRGFRGLHVPDLQPNIDPDNKYEISSKDAFKTWHYDSMKGALEKATEKGVLGDGERGDGEEGEQQGAPKTLWDILEEAEKELQGERRSG